MISAHFEPTGGIVRIFRNGEGFGAPFDLSLAVVGDEGVATLKALSSDGDLSRADFSAIAECLRKAGFHKMRWTRHSPEGIDHREFLTDRRFHRDG
jgi:hypothetical protein